MAKWLLLLFIALSLAGCSSTPPAQQSSGAGQVYVPPPPPPPPTKHDLASNKVEAVPAGETYHHPFNVQGSVDVTYTVTMRDDSSVDVGFVRDSDLAEYNQGQHVDAWAYQKGTAGTTQSATLSAGDYDLVISCDNNFADCDLTYSLSATY